MSHDIIIHAFWDPDASVWVAASDQVPGLATEASSTELLLEKLRIMIPELLAANGTTVGAPLPFTVITEQQATTAQYAA